MVLFEYLSTNLLGIYLKSEIAEEYNSIKKTYLAQEQPYSVVDYMLSLLVSSRGTARVLLCDWWCCPMGDVHFSSS